MEEGNDQVIASFLVKVVIRGPEGAPAPTISDIEDTIEEAIREEYVAARKVTASAERTDI